MELPEIHAATKLMVPTDWAEDGERLSIIAALEIDGATVEGLYLRATARRDIPDRAVMFQMEYKPPYQPHEGLCRIDWRPIHSHNNQGQGPAEYQFKRITGSHHHAFTENWLTADNRMRRRNLPIATPLLADPTTFPDLLALVAKEFRISNVGGILIPPWDLIL